MLALPLGEAGHGGLGPHEVGADAPQLGDRGSLLGADFGLRLADLGKTAEQAIEQGLWTCAVCARWCACSAGPARTTREHEQPGHRAEPRGARDIRPARRGDQVPGARRPALRRRSGSTR